ncbi:hypothetical protein MMC13_003108 [Lambiella insularis]|nr:hypothetical protein [Lambiella insularis]
MFKGVEGLNTQLKQLTFKAPFHAFYYRWYRFEDCRQDEENEETKVHLDLLYSILSEAIVPHIEAMKDLTHNKVMSFDDLWTIFAPGAEIYTKLNGQDRLMALTDNRYGANMSGEFFTLECQYIDCDGSKFGYVSTSVEINKFEGVKKLVDLDAYPCQYYPDVVDLVNRLHTRGEKLEQLNGFYHMSYTGFYTAKSSRQIRNRYVSDKVECSRIIIDPHTFNIQGVPGPGLGAIESDSHADLADNELLAGTHNKTYGAFSMAFTMYRNALVKLEERIEESLSAGSEFYVANVCPIRWSENAFPGLVLPHGYKDIIRAFVQEQLSHDDEFDDIVHGKGLGFIMLLSGPPGVGKTLTAEAVAEELHQPLYSINASELGETAIEIEESLEQVLELTSKWNAILLLDECDMFLEARSTADIRRNRLVSGKPLSALMQLLNAPAKLRLSAHPFSFSEAA